MLTQSRVKTHVAQVCCFQRSWLGVQEQGLGSSYEEANATCPKNQKNQSQVVSPPAPDPGLGLAPHVSALNPLVSVI